MKSQHIVPHAGKWAVKQGGTERATKIFDTQGEAIQAGKQIAQNQKAELFIHKKDGQIRERNSYGNDNYPPKG